jgi:hypothetical protein
MAQNVWELSSLHLMTDIDPVPETLLRKIIIIKQCPKYL